MKPLLSWTAFLILVVPAVIHAADFEGKVRMKMSASGGAPQTIDYAIKAGVVRTEFFSTGGASAAIIMNMTRREMTILMPQQQMYLVRPMPATQDVPGAHAAASDVAFEKTGETEKILGYDCTKYVAKARDAASELWLTEQLGSFAGLGGGAGPGPMGRGPAPAAWEHLLAGKDLFPLRVVTRSSAGTEQMRLEAESVERQPLPDSLFAPPADYRKLDMGGMMRGMGLPR